MIDFLKYRNANFAAALLLFVGFIGIYVYKWQTRGETFVYSVDFTGGTQILFGFSKPVASEKIVAILDENGLTGAVTRDFSSTEILVRIKRFENDADGLPVRIQRILEANIPETTVEIKQVDSVGGGVGESLRWKSTQAVVVGLLLMLLYIAFRFWSFAFALGAVLALFHDVITLLTVFLLFDIEISINVIGAILAVLGYSVNDTIVIFSRIRENIVRLSGTPMAAIVNISTNETLRRTILTSFATSLVVVSLVIFGGEVLRTLSLTLLIGFIFGTYSSICIASPIMLMFYKSK